MKIKFYHVLVLTLVFALMTSCVPRKDIAYFQGIENLTSESNLEPLKLMPNDILSIIVSAANFESTIPFNLISISRPTTGTAQMIGSSTAQEIPYMIDSAGKIHFPVLGEIQAEGLSPQELREDLTKRLKEYIKDPIVNIRILNFTVSVLGEVNRPGTFAVSGERIALPEALGMAGDMSIFGRRDNVLVIREIEGKKIYKYLDLRDSDILNSDFYYLRQHDVVYVEPNKAQRQSSNFNRNASVYVSIASLLVSVLVVISK